VHMHSSSLIFFLFFVYLLRGAADRAEHLCLFLCGSITHCIRAFQFSVHATRFSHILPVPSFLGLPHFIAGWSPR
jgi:hypothetical protein